MDPIIYIHKWAPKYLEISIEQSLKNNKRVFLIWDEKNLSIAQKYNIEHEYFDKYNNSNFKKYYIHNKPNTNYEYELICYERWFVLYEIMKKYNINRCVYLDSDILYYWNIDEEFNRIEKYGKYELAYPNFSWHTTYIFSQDSLKDFCEFIMKCYTDKLMYKKLLNWPLICQPWISDMSMFQMYKYNYPEKVFDLTKDNGDNIVYDGFINISEWYKTIFWKKLFIIKKSKVFFLTQESKKIQTKTLHFQMHMKTFMNIVYHKRIRLYYVSLIFTSLAERWYRNFSFVRVLRKKWKDKHLFR